MTGNACPIFMSIKDIEKVKFDIDYCIEKLEKPKKRCFLF